MTNLWDYVSNDILAAGLPPTEDTYSEDDLLFGNLLFDSMISSGTNATVLRAATGSSNFAKTRLEPTASCKDASVSITSAKLSKSAGATSYDVQDVSPSEGAC
jgi:hypothetical protein